MTYAAPTTAVVVSSNLDEVKFEGVARFFGRKPPNFSCSVAGVYCHDLALDGAKETTPVITHIFGRQIGPFICRFPGTHCAWSNGGGSTFVPTTSLHTRKYIPWSSCGFPGITCATAVVDDNSRDAADSAILGEDTDTPIDSLSLDNVYDSIEARNEKVVEQEIPWAPSTLATYGLPRPTAG